VIKIGVFLDTSFYLGLCHPKDKYAKNCDKILKILSQGDHGLLYTSSFIISEATTLVAIRTNSHLKVLDFLGKSIWGKEKIATILPFDSELERQTWKLFKKINTTVLKNKKPMSFVDISSVILCKHHQIDNIVSFDSHFDRFLERIY